MKNLKNSIVMENKTESIKVYRHLIAYIVISGVLFSFTVVLLDHLTMIERPFAIFFACMGSFTTLSFTMSIAFKHIAKKLKDQNQQ